MTFIAMWEHGHRLWASQFLVPHHPSTFSAGFAGRKKVYKPRQRRWARPVGYAVLYANFKLACSCWQGCFRSSLLRLLLLHRLCHLIRGLTLSIALVQKGDEE